MPELTHRRLVRIVFVLGNWTALAGPALTQACGAEPDQPLKTWVKRSPLATTPPSPRLGYEGACVWDSRRRMMIRYGGHNQGGGGEQGSELWTFDPLTARWDLKEPNISPPGVCCDAQNVFDPIADDPFGLCPTLAERERHVICNAEPVE